MKKEKVFIYLDKLRESGITNMFGATPYIMSEFGYEEYIARQLLLDWMKSFEKRHKK